MHKHLPVLILSAAVAVPVLTHGQERQQKSEQEQQQRGTRDGVRKDEQNAGKKVTRGRVKEFTPGQKITIDVPWAFDKSYDLAQQQEKQRVTVAEGLEVGQPVAVIEWEQNAVKFVRIIPQGAEAAMADGAFTPTATTTGRVQQITPGNSISIRIEGGGTRTFDLKRQTGPQVNVAPGVSSGDTVRITQGREDGRTVVHIDKADVLERPSAAGAPIRGEKTRQPRTDENKK